MDLLRSTDRIDLALSLGESHFREFKSALEGPPSDRKPRSIKSLLKDVSETLVAFANADGGELLLGIEDDGSVTGVPGDGAKMTQILSSYSQYVMSSTPIPAPKAMQVHHRGVTILYFSISKGTEHIYQTSDGRCLIRRDTESLPIDVRSIQIERAERLSREYDRAFVDAATVDDLDTELLSYVADRVSRGMSREKCLQHLDLAEFDGARMRLRRAALLLFAKNPHRWHPRLQVRILKIAGTELRSGTDYNVVSDSEVTGNILKLLEASWEQLRPHLTETRFSSDAVFHSQIIYPEFACREALTNAIAHRDYHAEGRSVEVHVYTDRMEILNPGELVGGLTVADLRELKNIHQSRNSLIARVLREVGYMREIGEGIKRIFELMQSNDLAVPELVSINNTFSIVLHHKFLYSDEEKLWLNRFTSFTLSREQKTVVRLGIHGKEISPQAIWEAVGIVDTDYYRQLVESLKDLGLLYRSRTKSEVQKIQRTRRLPKKRIPQLRIRNPEEVHGRGPQTETVDDSVYSKIYVANIPFTTRRIELFELFSQFGDVANIQIPIERETRRPKGFAFVEFENRDAAQNAIAQANRLTLGGRTLYINNAEPRQK